MKSKAIMWFLAGLGMLMYVITMQRITPDSDVYHGTMAIIWYLLGLYALTKTNG